MEILSANCFVMFNDSSVSTNLSPIVFCSRSAGLGKYNKGVLFVGIFLFVTYPVTGPLLARALGETAIWKL